MKQLVFSLMLAALPACSLKAQTMPDRQSLQQGRYTTRIVPAPGHTYGYEILLDGKPTIRQTSRPGLPGNNGFRTRAAAQRVAALVVGKMKSGQMPPTVTPDELKRLHAD